MTCVAISRTIGPVPVDVVLEETHRSDLEITRNPIEFGADVTDHAYVMPKRITLRCAVASSGRSRGITNAFDSTRAAAAWQSMLMLQALRQPFALVTGLKVYPDMLIESLEATRDPEKSYILDFRADLLQVIIVSSAMAAPSSSTGKSAGTPGGPIAGGAADGRAGLGAGVNRGPISGTAAPTGVASGGGVTSGVPGGGASTVAAGQNSAAYDALIGD